MNKKLLFFISFLLLCIMTMKVGALSLPMVVSGEVVIDGSAYGNQEITITDYNLNSYSWTTTTLNNGRYMVVLNNLKDAQGRYVNAGHIIYIDACDVTLNTACRKTITAGYDPIDLSWYNLGVSDISTGAINTEDIAWCNNNVCTSCDPCPECEDCEEPECAEVICPIITDCDPCPECPGEGFPWLETIIGASGLIVGLGAGGYFTKNKVWGLRNGIKRYRKADGTEAVLHKHPGIRGYHDPKITHRDAHERHLKGQLNPHYKKAIEGKLIGQYVYDK